MHCNTIAMALAADAVASQVERHQLHHSRKRTAKCADWGPVDDAYIVFAAADMHGVGWWRAASLTWRMARSSLAPVWCVASAR